MGTKLILSGIAAALIIVAAFALAGSLTYAQQPGSIDPETMQKIDAIADDQKAILAELAQIKEQLRILTIRVTQQQ